MTPVQFAEYVRYKTKTNSATLTDSQLTMLYRVVKNRIVLDAVNADEDIFLVPTTQDLVADQREYPFISSMLSAIKRVEAKLDGTNYIVLKEFDLPSEDNAISTEADIVSRFGNQEGSAFFDIMRESLWIYSGTITDVTDGLKIWVNTEVPDITDWSSTTDMSIDPSNTTHGVPAPLHSVIATGIIIEYKESKEKPMPLSESELRYDLTVKRAIDSLKRTNYSREVIGLVPVDEGYNY